MIKSNRENQGHDEQQHQHAVITGADNQQEKETDEEDHELGGNDVGENRAHKKTVLTLKQRQAAWAVMPYVKRSSDDSGFATGRTTQSQTTPQHLLALFKIYIQRLADIFSRKDAKAQRRRKVKFDPPLRSLRLGVSNLLKAPSR
jgi:hypothetical protein